MKRLLVLLIFSVFIVGAMAEGSKQVRPNANDDGYLTFWKSTLVTPFANYNCPADNRLNIRICNIGEKVYFGFNCMNPSTGLVFRIKNPLGNIVYAQTAVPSAAATGYIPTHANAVAGPNQIVGTGGYDAFSFTPTMTGDYFIEFDFTANICYIELFDITVASAANTAINGRVWSKAWQFSSHSDQISTNGTSSATKELRGNMFIYSDDQIVTMVDLNGIRPYVFTIYSNNFGLLQTANPYTNRQSLPDFSTINPQYKIFLNDPDINCFPTGVFGIITNDVVISGCPGNYCINVDVSKTGVAVLTIDLNGITGYQPNSSDLIYQMSVNAGSNCIPWDGKDGLGKIVPQGASFDVSLEYINGLTHLPIFDAENHPNGFNVSLIRPTDPSPVKMFWDDSKITGGIVQSSGCTSNCHGFINNFGDINTINTWWYGKSSTKTTTITKYDAEADANISTPGKGSANDTTICATTNSLVLKGKVLGVNSLKWTSKTGGTFNNNTIASPTYTFSASEKTNGFAYVLLETQSSIPCQYAKDSIKIIFNKAPVVNAGSAQSICANTSSVSLGATSSHYSSLQWSGGAGTFSNTSILTPSYTPTATEKANGSVILTLKANGNAPCASASSNVTISFIKAPGVSAGTAQSLCADATSVSLNANGSNYSSLQWSGGAGTFSNASILNPGYTPTASEKASGSITLTIQANGNTPCSSTTSNVTISFAKVPNISAGSTQNLCANATSVSLSANGSNYSSLQWSGGTGTFSNTSILNPSYSPSASEKASGSVTLTIQANGNTPCTSTTSDVTISFVKVPSISAGSSQSLCADATSVALNANGSDYSSVQWSGGAGTFSSASIINPNYTPTATEKASGSVTLTIKANGNSPCSSTSSNVTISFIKVPSISAGSAQSLCEDASSVSLSASGSDYSSLQWSGGAGAFSNASILSPGYTPTASEKASGSVTLTIQANGNAPCTSTSSNVTISFVKVPNITAGSAQSLCADATSVSLNANGSEYSSVQWSGGAGAFSNASIVNPNYTPTASEKASGSVTLTIKANGNAPCTATSSNVTISFVKTPSISAGNTQSLCEDASSVSLGASGSDYSSVQWSGGAGAFSNASIVNPDYTPTASEKANGSITLTIKAHGNTPCTSISSDVTINFVKVPNISAGSAQSLCADANSVSLNASGSEYSSLQWSGGTGTFSQATILNPSYTPTATEKANGSVTLTIQANGNTPCTSTTSDVTISFVKVPSISAGNAQSLCENSISVSLSATGSDYSSVQWTGGAGAFSSTSIVNPSYTPTVTEKANGSVTLTIQANGNAPCAATNSSVTISFVKVPNIFAGSAQSLCTDVSSISLNASGSNYSSLQWTGGAGIFSQTSILNPSYAPTASEKESGSITFTIQANGMAPCGSTSSNVTISFIPVPQVQLEDIEFCTGESGMLTGVIVNQSSISSYNPTYAWLKNNTSVNSQNAQLKVYDEGIYTFTVSIGKCVGQDNAKVKVNSLPILNLPKSVSLCQDLNQSALLHAGANFTSYLWLPGNHTTDTIFASEPGIYSVTVYDKHQCKASGEVLVREVCPPRVFVGNAFSPDGDGINDYFTVYGAHTGKFHMLIFNRWGEVIFESKDRDHAWDGSYKNEPMPIGVYSWLIEYEGDTEEFKGPFKMEGNVTIISTIK